MLSSKPNFTVVNIIDYKAYDKFILSGQWKCRGPDKEGATVIMGIKMMYTRPCVFHLQNIPVAEVCPCMG